MTRANAMPRNFNIVKNFNLYLVETIYSTVSNY